MVVAMSAKKQDQICKYIISDTIGNDASYRSGRGEFDIRDACMQKRIKIELNTYLVPGIDNIITSYLPRCRCGMISILYYECFFRGTCIGFECYWCAMASDAIKNARR